ncbi:putative secreted protein [Corynebacterium kutscheri]|uniref:Secreted protein n=1 Tax=Corynebacterium kutscheri TaxID=35755 RepID=A0A0F6TDI4_9CORY|nr:DUF2550 domain-containing protein [Corynebacterium kutscheri]AKE41631.1 Protein of unknown function (DUF2550) [Corynebacterium kutscheri]VEH08907.1 putative secreted protein [Corynebacterium kutscheri]VEH09958.1 putative secreted protein [Corynebacterium kutscheri]VEH80037.1 putative secreted protein [Corynebacterium kutscheri]
MMYFFNAIVLILSILALLALWRLATLRSKGTSVILRRLPASGLHRWRHGIFRYRGSDLEYFMVRSLAVKADTVLHRGAVELRGYRDTTAEEASFLSTSRVILFRHEGIDYELAGNNHMEMAFTAWVEAAPDVRMDKMSPKVLRRKFKPSQG